MKTALHSINIKRNVRPLLLLFSFLMVSALGFAQVTKTSTGTAWATAANWSPAGVPAAGDNIIINSGMTAPATAITIGNLTVNGGFTFTMAAGNITVNGNTQINGTLADNSSTGTNSFLGTFSVAAGGNYTTTSTSPLIFGGNISNAGTFNRSGAGAVNFADSLSINGPNAIILGGGNITIDADMVVTNNAVLTLSGTLNGANANSSFFNSTGATINYSGATLMASGFFDASATNNTVNYASTPNQTVRSTTYHHITFSGGGTKTIPDLVVNGNFTRSAGTLTFSASTLTFEGSTSNNLTLTGGTVTFPNTIINKPGGVLTIVPGGAITSTFASVSIPAGDLAFGTTATTIRINGDLAGAGSISMTGAAHTLRLFGVNNAIGTLNSGTSTVEYGAAGDQNVF
ncbi:MAG: hypothetical protein ACK5CY_03665, partial [Bacteroidia bacterium]